MILRNFRNLQIKQLNLRTKRKEIPKPTYRTFSSINVDGYINKLGDRYRSTSLRGDDHANASILPHYSNNKSRSLRNTSRVYVRNHLNSSTARHKSALAIEDHDHDHDENAALATNNTLSKNRIPFILTDIGEGIHEVEIIQWYISPGDTVQQFDLVCQVQSDKATVDITSRYDGVIDTVCGEVGDMLRVGSPLVFLRQEQENGNINGRSTSIAEHAEQNDRDDDDAGSGVGNDDVHLSANINNVTNDPAGPVTAVAAVTDVRANDDDSSNLLEHVRNSGKVLATPAVRRLSMEFNVDLSTIEGTGKDGRILKSDVLQELKLKENNEQTDIFSPAAPAPNLNRLAVPASDNDEILPIRGYNRIMVKAMQTTLQVPHMVYTDEVEMTALRQCRRDLKPLAVQMGLLHGISYLPFAIKACSLAMLQYPLLNSSIDAEKMVVIVHKRHDIGVAIDSPKGLVVPVIRNCQDLSVLDIALELQRLRELAENGALTEDHLTSPTFTLSNIGSIGGTVMSPVVLPPQVAIGAMGKIQRLPRFVSEESFEVQETHLMNISWGGDHRVLDGGTLGRFSNAWKSYIEKPVSMVFNMK